MTGETLLRAAYACNILILSPVLFSLYGHRGPGALAAFSLTIANVDGLRLLVAALWAAVLILSLAGLVWPRELAALLLFQVIYKALYLATYVAPLVAREGWNAAPLGVAAVFAFIVIVWPLVLAAAFRPSVLPA